MLGKLGSWERETAHACSLCLISLEVSIFDLCEATGSNATTFWMGANPSHVHVHVTPSFYRDDKWSL